MRTLYKYRSEAFNAACKNESTFAKSVCDLSTIDEVADGAPTQFCGETGCYVAKNGNVFAWWEDDSE